MTSASADLHIRTPLVYSAALSRDSGANVYLKLENTQPCGSFKNRGIGALASSSVKKYGPSTHLICSSGGNAGLACAYSALRLGVRCTVFLPSTAKPHVLSLLQSWAAETIVAGAHWAEADAAARKAVAEEEGAVYVPPFDHPEVVEGHSGMIAEIEEQLAEWGIPGEQVAGLACSVGGGGLLAGLLTGLGRSKSLQHVPILACETLGTHSLTLSLSASLASNTATLAALPSITSLASTLGAVKVSQTCLDLAWGWGPGVFGVVGGDAMVVDGALKFLDQHAFLVEPACSAALLPIYSPQTLRSSLPHTTFPPPGAIPPRDAPVVVVIVCGGLSSKLSDLEAWSKGFEGVDRGEVKVLRIRD